MKIAINYTSPEEALQIIQSGNRVFVQGSAQTPTCLLKELAKQAYRLNDVELVFISVYGDICVDKPGLADSFKINSLFVSASVRDDVQAGRDMRDRTLRQAQDDKWEMRDEGREIS